MAASRGWRSLVIPVAVATLAAVVLSGGLLWAGGAQHGGGSGKPAAHVESKSQHDFGPAPSYMLTDQNGDRVSSKRLDGKVQIVSFLFPYCTTDCPILARDLARLQHKLAAKGLGDKTAIVTFNVDPGGPGPRQLSEFLHQYGAHADPATADVPWYFLTGSKKQIKSAVREGYHVPYWKVKGEEEGVEHPNKLAKQVDPGYDVKHADVIYLVDGAGEIRTRLDSTSQADPKTVIHAVRKVLRR
ncbi:MAG: SCO family protein [Streptosporangiales bacterium]